MSQRKVTLWRDFTNAEYNDPSGAAWVISPVTDEAIPCDFCGSEIEAGYLCLDGSEWVCDRCAEIIPAWLGHKLAAERAEGIGLQNRLVGVRCIVGQGLCGAFRAEHMPGKFLGWTRPSS